MVISIFDKWIGNLDIEKNTFLGTIFIVFFLKTVTNELDQWVVVTLVENAYYIEKDQYM